MFADLIQATGMEPMNYLYKKFDALYRCDVQYKVGKRRGELVVPYKAKELLIDHFQIITEGEVCTTQAVVKQIGINGVSATYVVYPFSLRYLY